MIRSYNIISLLTMRVAQKNAFSNLVNVELKWQKQEIRKHKYGHRMVVLSRALQKVFDEKEF